MLDIREIEYWISRYEQEADKLDQCVTLSALYNIRDKLFGGPPEPVLYSEAPAPVSREIETYGDSDFLRAVAGKDPVAAWRVMDEHMETLRVVNPRAYESVLRKLKKI